MKIMTVALSLFLIFAANAEAAVAPERARAHFERLKRLAGKWDAKSTKGWMGRYVVRVIARGTAVLVTGEFVDEPGEGMATLYYVDQGQLKLTHYCEAGNQPTLVLSDLSEDGARAEYTFLSGTGMASRDVGHMDHLIVRHRSDDAFDSRWSWFSKGTERWMEDIEYRRATAP